MADVTVESANASAQHYIALRGGIFWKSTTVGYVIFADSSYDLKYRKTSDGGDLMDRTKFAAINVVATNQIEWTFTMTFTAGG